MDDRTHQHVAHAHGIAHHQDLAVFELLRLDVDAERRPTRAMPEMIAHANRDRAVSNIGLGRIGNNTWARNGIGASGVETALSVSRAPW